MRRKSIGSRFIKVFRESVKKGCVYLAQRFFRSRSYPLFGIPTGLHYEPLEQKEIYASDEMALHVTKRLDADTLPLFEEAKFAYPGSGWIEMRNATATALGGNLTRNGKLVTTFLELIDGKPYHQNDLFRFSSSRFTPRIFHTQKPVVTFAAIRQGAFYHWMYDVLPRLHLSEKAGHHLETIYIAAGAGYERESLELLDIPPESIVDATKYDAITTPHLIIPSITTTPTKWGCQFLRDRFLPKLNQRPRRRLYVSRRDAIRRRVDNEEEVYSYLQKHRFEYVELAKLPLKEQMEIFHSAEIVIGPHGAGFSNLIVCNPGMPCLEFFHPIYLNNCYLQLANIVGLPYYYLLGSDPRHRNPSDPDPDMTIDLQKLDSLLSHILHDHHR